MTKPQSCREAALFIKTYRDHGFKKKDLLEKDEIPGYGRDFFSCSEFCYPYEVGAYYASCVELILNYAILFFLDETSLRLVPDQEC